MKSSVAVLILAAGLALPPTYDPVKLLPEAYSLQFENEWVKVVRVHYAPHAKLPPHAHTAYASAYVYLNDAGPVIFRHVGEKKFAATRPATKAGSFRVFRGIDEIHEVENTSDRPSEFLRVEFKTDPKDASTLRGRFFREPAPADENFEKVQFENEQVRITRLICAPGQSVSVTARPAEPALVIDLTSTVGKEHWVPAGQNETLQNRSAIPREMLRFDFKTRPLPEFTSSKQF
jgi:hypothetical protein